MDEELNERNAPDPDRRRRYIARFSIAMANAIAAHLTTVEETANRRIGRAMLGSLVTVGLSLAVASIGRGS